MITSLLQTGCDKTLPDLTKWTVGPGWIVVLQCIAMILLNVMFFPNTALLSFTKHLKEANLHIEWKAVEGHRTDEGDSCCH